METTHLLAVDQVVAQVQIHARVTLITKDQIVRSYVPRMINVVHAMEMDQRVQYHHQALLQNHPVHLTGVVYVMEIDRKSVV